jgi:branched-chain amino acid transport system permease protein
MEGLVASFRKNRTLIITLAVLVLLFIIAVRGMETKDWVITTLRGLAVGAVTFLVAAGFSLIFGLMHVLNLAHGTLFMIGAYVGWTVYVRPDTFMDILTPVGLLLGGILLIPLWTYLLRRLRLSPTVAKVVPWVVLLLAAVVLLLTFPRFPIAAWDLGDYERSPTTYASLADRGAIVPPDAGGFEGISPFLAMLGVVVGGAGLGLGLALFGQRRRMVAASEQPLKMRNLIAACLVLLIGIVAYFLNDSITQGLVGLNTNLLFLLAVAVATLTGLGLGSLIETTVVRPLYERHTYQILLTLGLSFMGVEMVRAIWGRPEFIMPKPALFRGTGDGCPATNIADWFTYQCSTIKLLGSRVRTYNEIFIILIGLIVLIAVWLLLQRSRLGMIIRAGVQDSEMVQALGIDVRRVFTLVFALGVALAALGGVLAGPMMGLSNGMGETLLLNALIALAIGGLTSYPGAAAGSVLVGLMQQFIIKYGSIGIKLPFMAEPFKPTPPLVPASTVLLMVIILLVLPQGLFGRRE